ncbi:MAG: orotate phosphoribosyltransferase [Bacteroidota bacterium]
MVLNEEIAKKTAGHLLQINAIKLNPENPFTWASGWKSPIYCDNRVMLSYPETRRFVASAMAAQIKELYPTVQTIAGVATGAIGVGLLVAEMLDLPFVYVRPEPKSHGRQNQIEGYLQEDHSVVVVEDLISTGKSSLNAVKALTDQNVSVLGMLAIFTYGFALAENNFRDAAVTLHTLSDYDHLIQRASETEYIKENQFQTLFQWKKNPEEWKQ